MALCASYLVNLGGVMSLVKTLAKVAVGMAVAKGVGGMMKSGGASRQAGSGGGLGDLLGQLTGGSGASSGGLGDLLGQLGGGSKASSAGGLGDLLGQLGGMGGSAKSGGGMGDLLGQLTGGSTSGRGLQGMLGQIMAGQAGGKSAGGLGGLLDGLSQSSRPGQSIAARAPEHGSGSFGDLINQTLAGGTSTHAPAPEQEEQAAVMLRAMIQAAKSDGRIDGDEQKTLMEHLGDIDAQEMAFINDELSKPIDINGLARDVPRGAEQQVYLMSLMAIDLDSQKEAQYLHAFAQSLNLSQAQVNAVHDHLGVQPLYT